MKETIDYSKKENWFQIPEITKDVDTFYIYATEYIMGSLMEGAARPWRSSDTCQRNGNGRRDHQSGRRILRPGWPPRVRITRSSTTTSRRTWPNVSQPIRRM